MAACCFVGGFVGSGGRVGCFPPAVASLRQMSSNYRAAILEVCTSEVAYVKDLRTISEVFFDPLMALFGKVRGVAARAEKGARCGPAWRSACTTCGTFVPRCAVQRAIRTPYSACPPCHGTGTKAGFCVVRLDASARPSPIDARHSNDTDVARVVVPSAL